MGFSLDIQISAAAVFAQGLLSFFSPCVLPLIPLYIGYLSGGTARRGEDGRMYYKRSRVMVNTLFFVLGISFTFFLLGMGISALGSFFQDNQRIFAAAGGILIILFGVYQLGVFGNLTFLSQEKRVPLKLNVLAMSPLTALLLGFTFSFAWTPCVGPALASVLIMAASAETKTAGFLLIGVYTLGFVLPFLAVGLFTTSLLELFKKYGNIVKYTVKAGAVLMILMGLLMVTGKMNDVTGYLAGLSQTEAVQEAEDAPDPEDGEAVLPEEETEEDQAEAQETETESAAEETGEAGQETSQKEPEPIPAADFALEDQYGNVHTLEDYKGKTIFLNFWATWCPPCRAEMPDIQKLYESYDTEGDDALVVLGVAAPGFSQEGSEEEIKAFLEDNGYTYPVLMDTEAELFYFYGIMSYPTTFMIDRDGNIFGYVTGQLNYEIMEDIVRQTMEGKR